MNAKYNLSKVLSIIAILAMTFSNFWLAPA